MVSFENIKAEYERNWSNMRIRPARAEVANETARKALRGKDIYEQVEERTGVKWYFIALLHSRESDFDFDTYLGNGQSLHRVTTIVPRGRGPFASFVDGAVDALRLEGFIDARDWGIAKILFRLEKFNGFGYRSRAVNSPYLWGGSNIYGPPEQRAGKFVADGVFDPNKVDPQLGAAVILQAMMALDPSITLDDAPLAPGHVEPEEALAPMALLMQQSLNKLGANPPLDEDGIIGPKTKTAVLQFQMQHGLSDTGILDSATTAAITRAAQQSVTVAPAADLSPVLKRLESLVPLFQSGPRVPAAPNNPAPAAADPINLLERLLTLVNKTGTAVGTVTPSVPGIAPVNQLKQVIDLLGALLNKDNKPVLGQVNGAFGETVGKMLDGRKTALGIGGSVLTALLSSVTASPNAGGIAGLFGTIVSAVPGLGQFAMPISLALAAWGVLGKLEKWAQGTAPPPKTTT
jgi:lysozyme family protein/peptidoglycan hydrolase-like protein with peptidoglycan-binding domain